MKKLIAILCAVMLVLTCSISVFAEGEGTIIIKNAVEGKVYNAYKMLDLVKDGDIHKYTVAEGWAEFFGTGGAGAAYVNIVDGIVTWKGEEATKDADAAALAAAAMAYVVEKNISATATQTAADNENEISNEKVEVQFTGLNLGYYLVDSNLGAICSLHTTSPDAEIDEKNSVPTVDKVIVEDDNSEVKTNTAKIGDTVSFKSTITVNKGLEALTWYDTMSAGLTYVENTFEIAGLTTDDYTVTIGDHNITVVFTSDYLKKLTTATNIVITYDAILNENAVTGDADDGATGNTNTVKIIYGNDPGFESTPVITTTYTYEFDLVKTDTAGNVLAGAQFKLYDADKDGNEIKVAQVSEGVYCTTTTGEGVAIVVPEDGKVTIKGLVDGTYYLEETVAPVGYNKLTTRKAITIAGKNENATVTDGKYAQGGVQIINNSGNRLPSTGGMGTTLFIAIGAIVVLVTGVILVARKRMSKYVA